MKKIVIFCSASTKIDPKYNEAARELARELHRRGYALVSGGGAIGTMGAITDEFPNSWPALRTRACPG